MSKALSEYGFWSYRQTLPSPAPMQLLFYAAFLLFPPLVLFCFWPALNGPFIFDDFPNLENLRLLNNGVSFQSLASYLAAAKDSPGRPLAMLSFLLEDSAWPAYPADFKRDNLLFHLIAGLLLLWLIFKLARRLRLSEPARHWIPLICAVAWLLNPMQLSSTMLIVQRMNILSSLFVLAGLIAYLFLLESKIFTPLVRIILAGSTLVLFAILAFLCKENGVLIFAYASVLNSTLLRALLEEYPSRIRKLLQTAAAAPIVALVIAAVFNWSAIEAPYQLREFSLQERVLSQPRVLFGYLFNILIPHLGGQGIFHDDFIFSRSLLDPPATLFALVFLIAAVSAAVTHRNRAPLLAFAVLWFLAGHLIESSVVGLELYFEHRNYLPMIGPLFALITVAARSTGNMNWTSRGLLIIWMVACATLVRINAYTWGDRGLQSQVWLQEHPQSMRAAQWAASYQFDSGNPALARTILMQSLERMPRADDLRLQITLLDCMTHGVSKQQWANTIDTLSTARYSSLTPQIFSLLVQQFLGNACHNTLDQPQLQAMAESLLGNPAYLNSADSLAFVHYELAKIYVARRELDLLMYHLDQAYHCTPAPNIAREQAIYLLSAGLPKQALIYLKKSNDTPLPWFKRLMLNVPASNAELIKTAQAMLVMNKAAEIGSEPQHATKPIRSDNPH